MDAVVVQVQHELVMVEQHLLILLLVTLLTQIHILQLMLFWVIGAVILP